LTRRVSALATALFIGLGLTAGTASGAESPCVGPQAGHLLCPNLKIAPPSEIFLSHGGHGRALLHATSNVESRGRGPMELRGVRNGRRTMKVHQRIYRTGGGHIDVPTQATLHFTDVGSYFGGSYWKLHQLAHFELWSVDAHHRLVRRVRTGPKLNYCLRDLERTRPGPSSPSSFHYPGCNQNPFQDRVTLGTSVGWSDIYPADYSKQWINVAGLRGCFAFVMRVDPRNLLYESDERDNSSRRLVHLPFHGRAGC
jgi:hypothetical protein